MGIAILFPNLSAVGNVILPMYRHSETAKTLERESGFQLETHLVAEFRDNVLTGRWDAVEALLESMQITDSLLIQVRGGMLCELMRRGV